MGLTTREWRLPLTIDVPSCTSRYTALAPVAADLHGKFCHSEFDTLAVMGHGYGGTVYKVRHRCTSALYALKILRHGEPRAAAAEAEADIARRLVDSPHVVRCHSVLPTSTGDVALLLELVDGGSLDSLVCRGRAFPEAATAEVAAQMLSGLAHLRAQGVVHRDVKPGNLLVSRDGNVKLADFGVARRVVVSRGGGGDDHCCAQPYEGTAAYMSPERFDTERLRDEHGDDPYAADVWSLGMTVLELVMGRHPLLPPEGQKPGWGSSLMWDICFGEAPALPADGLASPELRDFVAMCLRKDHRERATVAELLGHPFVAGRDVAAARRALCEVIDLQCRS